MSAPRRLAEEGTDFERGLLASARLDVGRNDGVRVTLVALGAGAAATTLAASTAASTAGGAVVAAGGTGVAAGGAGTAFVAAGAGVSVKWVGVAALVLVAGAGVGVTANALAPREPRPVAAMAPPLVSGPRLTSAPGAPTLRAQAAVVPGPAPIEQAVAAPAAPSTTSAAPALPRRRSATPVPAFPADPARASTVPAPVPAPAPAPTLAPPQATAPSTLLTEVAALDRARGWLAQGDALRALGELDAHDRAFPASLFAEEAEVLRIDALVERGERAGAAAQCQRFLAANPSSPHAAHVRHVLAELHIP